jgi:hypothetical protein
MGETRLVEVKEEGEELCGVAVRRDGVEWNGLEEGKEMC